MLFSTKTPKYLWGEAVLRAAFFINRMPTKVLHFKKPVDVFKNCFPTSRLVTDISLKKFGCTAFVHTHSHNHGKLDHKARKCVFVGYSSTQKGYKCFDPVSRKLFVSMDVTFFETTPYFDNNHLQGESESEDSCVGDVFQIEPEPPVLVEFTPDQPIPSALENQDTATIPSAPENQDTAAIDQHLNRDSAATDQHLNQNTTAIDQDSGSLGDEINGTNPLMSLHKHEKVKMREKTSKIEHELHVYSRKRHLQRKEDSTLQQLHESQVQMRILLVPQMSCQVNFLWCQALLSPSLSQSKI